MGWRDLKGKLYISGIVRWISMRVVYLYGLEMLLVVNTLSM